MGFFKVEKENTKPCDSILLSVILLLLGTGLSFLFSASYPNALRLFKSPEYFFVKQLVMVAAGLAAVFIITKMSVSNIRKFVSVIVLLSLLLSVIVLITGKDIQGARRWIIIGNLSFQPSELVKLAIILYLADVFSRKEDTINEFYTISHPLVITTLFIVLTFAQNDFSTSVFLLLLGASLFFIAGVKFRYFIGAGLVAAPFLVMLIFSREHRVKRLIAFLDPEIDPAGVGYQIIQAKEALVSGGFWGRGIGSGLRKFGTLPEAHSDFILAAIGEEVGFIGILIVILLFVFFAARGYKIAFDSTDRFCFFVSFGITTSILYQAILNMAVVSGAIPATGITLPFFSHGGTSMLVTLIMCGILLNLSKNCRNEKGNTI